MSLFPLRVVYAASWIAFIIPRAAGEYNVDQIKNLASGNNFSVIFLSRNSCQIYAGKYVSNLLIEKPPPHLENLSETEVPAASALPLQKRGVFVTIGGAPARQLLSGRRSGYDYFYEGNLKLTFRKRRRPKPPRRLCSPHK